jgi:beta-N-acetylhexosaminidase
MVLVLLLFINLNLYAQETTKISENRLKQMIGQMLIVGFDESVINANSPIVKYIEKYNIGGVILFDRFYTDRNKIKNIKSPQQLQLLTSKLKEYSKNKLIISIDQEGGKVQRLKSSYGFPSTPSAKKIAKKSITEAKKSYTTLAQMLSQNGINCNFAPVVDLSVNKNNPVIERLERSYGETPQVVTNYATVFINALHSQKILSVLKHFPGHGSSKDDSHKGFVDVTDTCEYMVSISWSVFCTES